jgi:hypothetical protein
MSHTEVRIDPASYQAICNTCGWHTVPMSNQKRTAALAKAHEAVCPNPPEPRMGATMGCGCWWYATPGSYAGVTRADCPLHSNVMLVDANVPAPQPDEGGHWVAEREHSEVAK